MYEYGLRKRGCMINLSGRNFLKIEDFTPDEIRYLLDSSKKFKKLKKERVDHEYLKGRTIALIFEKTSTRTRCSFEVAAYDLGMKVTYLNSSASQLGNKESVYDTAKVLGRIYDGIEFRGFKQESVELLGKEAGVPVWNGLTDYCHPTQVLADFLTMEENFGHLKGLNLVYIGDARNNISNSLMIMSAKMGVNFTSIAPRELWTSEEVVNKAKEIAKETGSIIKQSTNPDDITNADAVYTDVWVSMGEADELWEKRINLLKPYQVNKESFSKAKDTAIFLHALPSFHDLNTTIGQDIYKKYGLTAMEVTDDVFLSGHSKVFDESENRMHTIKAVMYETMKDE